METTNETAEAEVTTVLSDLPRLKSLSGCPKCGETGTFCLKKVYCTDVCLDDAQEHLHVNCEKCGYERMAQCADAPVSSSEDPPAEKKELEKVQPIEVSKPTVEEQPYREQHLGYPPFG